LTATTVIRKNDNFETDVPPEPDETMPVCTKWE